MPHFDEIQQRRIERSLIQAEELVRDLLQPLRDPVAVLRSERVERFQDHQVQRPLQHVRLFIGHHASPGPTSTCWYSTGPYARSCWTSTEGSGLRARGSG